MFQTAIFQNQVVHLLVCRDRSWSGLSDADAHGDWLGASINQVDLVAFFCIGNFGGSSRLESAPVLAVREQETPAGQLVDGRRCRH